MDWKLGGLALIGLLATGAAASADAPFCHVSATGLKQCHYWNMQSCQSAASSLGGICVYQDRQAPPQQQGGFVDAMQRGAAAAAAERESRARAARDEAAAASLRAQQPPANCQHQRSVVYSCPDAKGEMHLSATPALGCMVVAVDP